MLTGNNVRGTQSAPVVTSYFALKAAVHAQRPSPRLDLSIYIADTVRAAAGQAETHADAVGYDERPRLKLAWSRAD